ncbi:calcium homeostasis modulator protein 6 [Pseudochaenichthys georgianus]|uniref:calcium homeostasis modulator protein 6 n=1 Tax=Pseudochaenichthys georgianus TaxID=52239 RepID=UPI00146E04F5|nr:calcium homeostasis modulator protein 6 [Pseudochaenichthys georgianus]
MEMFKTAVAIAHKQTSMGLGLVALTAGGEQIFSTVVFSCPCNQLNFLYGLVFLLVPALALLLLGFILSENTWKVLTGMCQEPRRWRRLFTAGSVLCRVSCIALVAPCSWIAMALLNGKYYECAMTGTNVTAYIKHLCGDKSLDQCQQELSSLPCLGPKEDRQRVLITLRADSQILGWLLIASIMLSNLLMICMARCTSPISYLQLKFWRTYVQEESNLMDSYSSKHAKELAKRNLKSFFDQEPPANISTPSNRAWKKISSLYKFSTKDHYYSTIHRYVEESCDNDMMKIASVKSSGTADNIPAALGFVDDVRMA